MISTTSLLPILSLALGLVSASPFPVVSTLTRRAGDEVVCGTTQDADLAACQSILDNWTGELVDSNECHFGGFWRGYNNAFNVASVEGCSVYMAGTADKEQLAVKEAVERLLGCADKEKGKVNGVTTLADGTYVCIGGNDGCGDCFDDADIDHLADEKRNALEKKDEFAVAKRDFPGSSAVDVVFVGIADAISNMVGEDNLKRENGIRNMVDGMVDELGNVNVVACHTEHEAKFDGEEGKDWHHRHFEIGIQIGGNSIGYELYVGNTGTFKRIGDGGYINWGWNAAVDKEEEDGSFLTFANRL